ncbi:acyl carrier protein [Pelagibacterales bacterium SAG-MED35]|nr:acyl carrier protein [Pelagibacterales bacterium SAG-MED35]
MANILQDISKALNLKKKINNKTELSTLSEWDSLGTLSIIGLADSKYKKIINGDDLSNCKTIEDIVNLLK